jgi:hypothetical protein
MKLRDIPPGRTATGASLGALLILLDLRPETVEERCSKENLRDAMAHCLTCPTHLACARWIADHERRPNAWHGFCPNAPMLRSARPGLPPLGSSRPVPSLSGASWPGSASPCWSRAARRQTR